MSTTDTAAVRRAWGWVAALRAGAATPWRDWEGEATPETDRLPGAQQLELLRRLNLAHPDRVSRPLADRVLAADAPGRGRSDLPLIAAADRTFGPPPVDPAELAADELLRIATGLIAEDLAACHVPEPAPRRHRPWAPSYRLVGDDWQCVALRRDLQRLARFERDDPKRVFVLATDLATLLTDAWTARAFGEGGAGWSDWLAPFVADDRLPARADVLAVAASWAERIGDHRVVVVTEPQRLRRQLLVRHELAAPPPVTAVGVDLARRIGATLGILVPAERRTRLLHEVLLPRLPQDPSATLAVPREWHGWVAERAERMRNDLLGAGYPVLGDPDAVVPAAPAAGADPAPDDVLDRALDLLAEPVRTEEAT